jgi:Tol biopolymer transport system component
VLANIGVEVDSRTASGQKERQMRKRSLLALLAAFTSVLAFSGAAHAKVPGPNGMIAFTRTDFSTGHDTTYIVNPDGGHLQALLPGIDTSGPHWSPDGSELALLDEDTPCPPCSASTIILNPDTGKYRVLPPPAAPDTSFGCSLWSPDASHFACGGESDANPSADGIYTIRTSDGGGLTRITDAGGGELTDIPIDYSPDGTRLVFGRVSSADHSCIKGSGLFVVNVDGSGLHRITPNGFCDDDGSWSPDGSKIIFEHEGSLFVVRPNGTGLANVPLTTGSNNFEGDATWSPDGTMTAFILFACTNVCDPGGIGTANADGKNVQQITAVPAGFHGFDHEADWGTHPLIR